MYRKQGRRYIPMSRIDIWDYREPGAYLTVVKLGSRSEIRCVDIDAAGVQAAMRIAADAMVTAMCNASALQPTKQETPITLQQRALLDQLEATGFNTSRWEWRSLMDVVEAGVKEMKAVMDSK